MGRAGPTLIEIVVLTLWLGAAVFLSAVVAPSLFAVLPSRTLAGAVVGRLLPVIFYAGILVAALVIGLEVAGRGGWAWRGREVAGLIMIGASAIAQLGVGPRIERLRGEIGRPIEELALDDARRVAFGRLHGISVAWLGLAMLAAVVAAVIAARSLHTNGGR